ncbi:hypothetical protein F4802DRAFT_565905 [Xylaria palmicola]|nr:hypothetical protein F4802DRAFT_565905 [Xylaria palmicola]
MLSLTAYLGLFAALASGGRSQDRGSRRRPIVLDSSGGFNVAGKVIPNPRNPNMTLTCDHGYVEYFLPWRPRRTSLFMWHSSSTQTWQNRFDGGEGFKDMFLRRDYKVYLFDAPRLGRANWACEPTFYVPDYRDQGNHLAWNFGPGYPEFWPDTQFPAANKTAWQQATGSRYVEYDTVDNVWLHARAAAVAADSYKVGDSIVYLTNSASGLRAQLAVTQSNTTNTKAIVAYESYGYVFPDTANVTGIGPFGPIVVPLKDFKKLARLPAVQYIFSDHRPENFTFLVQARRSAQLINMYGGNAQILRLGKDAGLHGSTHIAFADMDNHKVAGLLDKFLRKNRLDAYAEDRGNDRDDDDDDDDDQGDEDGDWEDEDDKRGGYSKRRGHSKRGDYYKRGK